MGVADRGKVGVAGVVRGGSGIVGKVGVAEVVDMGVAGVGRWEGQVWKRSKRYVIVRVCWQLLTWYGGTEECWMIF